MNKNPFHWIQVINHMIIGPYSWTDNVTHKHSWPDPLELQASSHPRRSRSPRRSGCRNSWSGLCLPGIPKSRRWSVCSQWLGPELSRCQNLCCGLPGRGAGRGVIQASSKGKVHGKRTHFQLLGNAKPTCNTSFNRIVYLLYQMTWIMISYFRLLMITTL